MRRENRGTSAIPSASPVNSAMNSTEYAASPPPRLVA